MHFIEILVPTDNYAFDDQDLNSGNKSQLTVNK